MAEAKAEVQVRIIPTLAQKHQQEVLQIVRHALGECVEEPPADNVVPKDSTIVVLVDYAPRETFIVSACTDVVKRGMVILGFEIITHDESDPSPGLSEKTIAHIRRVRAHTPADVILLTVTSNGSLIHTSFIIRDVSEQVAGIVAVKTSDDHVSFFVGARDLMWWNSIYLSRHLYPPRLSKHATLFFNDEDQGVEEMQAQWKSRWQKKLELCDGCTGIDELDAKDRREPRVLMGVDAIKTFMLCVNFTPA